MGRVVRYQPVTVTSNQYGIATNCLCTSVLDFNLNEVFNEIYICM
jgi:hypothetical protein